ncbi:MAG: HAMP domain-containing protein [Alphaproteobacteria bacterium]|nr:HAMP domain-containing protein [Alphaproteobacteria bacterium]
MRQDERSGKGLIKRLLPRTLFGRSLLILITPVLLIQVIATYVFFDRHWGKMTTRLAYAVAGEIGMIVDLVESESLSDDLAFSGIQTESVRHLDLDILFRPDESFLSGKKLEAGLYGWEFMVAKRLSLELQAQLEHPFSMDIDFPQKQIKVSVLLDGGILDISFPQRRLFSSSGYIFLLWVMCSSVVLLVIAIVFMRNQIRPIRKLAAAAERFGKGRDAPFFKAEGASEVRQAAHAFLDMRRRIQRQVSQRTEMLAGVSHDLRTPLTRLKLQLAMLEQTPDTEAMKADIQDMEKMIQGYLDFVRGQGDEVAVPVDMDSFFKRLLGRTSHSGVEITEQIEAGLEAVIRPVAFERALTNLLSNAAKYASHIWLSMHKDGKVIEIRVEDNGPGIAQEQYEEVFKPFYRVDSSRNAETGGTGLGLPIAMDIVHSHGGKIWLEESEHGGLKVIVRIPL